MKKLFLHSLEEVTVMAFADDVAVIKVAKYKEEVTVITDGTIRMKHESLSERGLELASQKTETDTIVMTVDGH